MMDGIQNKTDRLVHLDLKGAPFKVSFYEKLFPFIKDLGATGILIEWEDTFPYSQELKFIGSLSNNINGNTHPYTVEDARQIITVAENCSLTVIPLVQTFGHMEFVLKREQWSHLREVQNYPSSMCPSKDDSMSLVRSMLEQVINFHGNLEYIHIGGDEVWHLGLCKVCVKRMENGKYDKAGLYLDHMVGVVQFIKSNYPSLKCIVWDDMFRHIAINILQEYELGELVEPMIWHYNNMETFSLDSGIWDKYNIVFKYVWCATAFKGATRSCQILPVHQYHISNHEAWLTELQRQSSKIRNFRGVAFTGWSRFDHFATLCELLPCAIPSLTFCITTWFNGKWSNEMLSSTSNILGYQEEDMKIILDNPHKQFELKSQPNFPGWQIFDIMRQYIDKKHKHKMIVECDQVNTWLNKWQIKSNRVNPMQIESIASMLHSLSAELTSLEAFIKNNFEEYFFTHTIDEIIGTLIIPMKEEILTLKTTCENLLNVRYW